MDIATLGLAVDSRQVVEADKKLDKLAQTGGKAEKATNSFSKAANESTVRLGRFGRSAGQAGIQIQQFVGQVQGGQSAFVALSQQAADLGFVLGFPLAGAVVSIGAAIAGSLIPSLVDAQDEMEETDKDAIKLAKSFRELSRSAQGLTAIRDRTALTEITAEIESTENAIAVLQRRIESRPGNNTQVQVWQSQIDRLNISLSEAKQRQESLQQRLNDVPEVEAANPEGPSKSFINAERRVREREQRERDQAQRRFDSLTFSLAGEEGAIAESYARRQEIVANAHENGLISDEKRNELALELAEKHAEDLDKLQQATRIAQLSSYGEMFDGLAGLAEAFGGRQSNTYRALFAASKAFAVAESIVKIQQGIASAAALPFPANIPAIGAVIAQTAGIVSTIQSTNIEGVAHSGMTNIPREGTYLLDGGERVIQPEQNRDLTRFLENGGSAPVVNIHNYSGQPVEQRQNGNQIDLVIGRVRDSIRDDLNRGRGLANDFQQTYGLSRQGVV